MKEHFKAPTAVVVMLLREVDGKTQVLLQRRQNTGFMDGLWDLSYAGHVEHGESMKDAAVREAKEELGVGIAPEKLEFFTLIHKREKENDLTFINGYFACAEFSGEPHICEPEKCSETGWFDLNNLPDGLIDDRKKAVKAYLNGVHYIEYGW
ncbi:MAG: NUDIX domain-containing protein [Clostridiales bacterium]|nr:NUDIX domain-containing protein [Clostridiales bacterium]